MENKILTINELRNIVKEILKEEKENKGITLADKLIKEARVSMKKLNDSDVEEFRKRIASAFDLKLK